MPRRPILLALLIAGRDHAGVRAPGPRRHRRDRTERRWARRRPPVVGTTLDGAAFDLASLRGKPVVVNFWGPIVRPLPRRIPAARGQAWPSTRADGFTVVGVLTDDPVEPARDFVARVRRRPGRRWSTRTRRSRRAYRVAARPQTYFVDRAGIIRLDPDRRADRRRLRAPVRADRRSDDRRPDGRRRTGWSSATGRGRCSTASRSTVAAGELVALLGPNGAGKTTTVEIVEGYRRADGGTVAGPRRRPGRRRARRSGPGSG